MLSLRYLPGWWRAARGDAARRATPAHRSGLPAGAEYRAKTVQQCSEQPGPGRQAGRQQAAGSRQSSQAGDSSGQRQTEPSQAGASAGWSVCSPQVRRAGRAVSSAAATSPAQLFSSPCCDQHSPSPPTPCQTRNPPAMSTHPLPHPSNRNPNE